MDCLFCKIVKGEIACDKVYEDDKVLAFLDISPVSKGHTLVVPKEHYGKFTETDDVVIGDLMLAAKRIALGMEKALGIKDVNFGINNGQLAGQVVEHTHIHVMPRSSDDGLRLWPGREYQNDEEKKEVAQKIAQAMD